MEKFHYFLYGKEFTLETDPKPLVCIFKKHMIDISPRIQRLLVRSFPYQPFKVVYKKGTHIPVADALSRVTPMEPEDNIQLSIIAVNMITYHVSMCQESRVVFSQCWRKLEELQVMTRNSISFPSTLSMVFWLRNETFHRIFNNIGHTRNCYPLNMDSLLKGKGS